LSPNEKAVSVVSWTVLPVPILIANIAGCQLDAALLML